MAYNKPTLKAQYENFIGGEWVAPIDRNYFEAISPIDNKPMTRVAKSNKKDVKVAIDAAWKGFETWGKTSVTQRSAVLNKIADVMETNLEMLAIAESWDNGKAIRETISVDLPLAIDHFRYFAGVIRSESGTVSDLDGSTVSQEIYEPLGVVGQILPWNFPLLMAAWKIAPAIAAGNCVVLKPAEQTPVSILLLMEVISNILPAGVINIVNGFDAECGKPLALSKEIRKIGFTGETATGKLIMQYASENIIPATLELGGKSPNIFMESIMDEDDAFFDKAIEGLVLFAFNQGEVCTCPSRALIQESIYEPFMKRVLERVAAIKMGDPLDISTMMGAQASVDQYKKILNYISIGKDEGAELLAGGGKFECDAYPDGCFIQPTIFKGSNKMRIFQEDIFGPVLSVTTFEDIDEALEIANDTIYGLGAGVWTRNVHEMQKLTRGIEAGRIWANCYHVYPAHASFGGHKLSGIGRERHVMTLSNYRRTKNILTSYSESALGLF